RRRTWRKLVRLRNACLPTYSARLVALELHLMWHMCAIRWPRSGKRSAVVAGKAAPKALIAWSSLSSGSAHCAARRRSARRCRYAGRRLALIEILNRLLDVADVLLHSSGNLF